MKINKISPDENDFTKILTSVNPKPQALYYIGTLPNKRQPTITIVGTRKPTKYGQEVTHTLAYELAKRGVVIVSGLALGIDGIAHRAALEAGGTTLAVLANGLSQITPRTHRQLGIDILAAGGAILSEYEPGVAPAKFRFLERNRLVSGLSDGVLITEAAARSGTLSTAARALEQGKDVFVVPGNITSPLSAGCNQLIRSGAIPVTRVEDILEVIMPHEIENQVKLSLGDNEAQATLIELLQSGIRDGEEIQQRSGLEASVFSTELTMLEINGIVRALGSNQWTLR
jgi:DNA processing protein